MTRHGLCTLRSAKTALMMQYRFSHTSRTGDLTVVYSVTIKIVILSLSIYPASLCILICCKCNCYYYIMYFSLLCTVLHTAGMLVDIGRGDCFLLKPMNFVLEMMNFVFTMMDFAFKMMDFVFKMMILMQIDRRTVPEKS